MIKNIFFLCLLFCLSCSSDNITRSEKTDFYNIYKDIIIRKPSVSLTREKKENKVYNREWLSKFNQPIILLASEDGENTATLVALGNYQNKLTWVSADGISLSFENGILIATRGYSQDLMEAKYNDLDKLFTRNTLNRFKTYRYLNGKNEGSIENWNQNFSWAGKTHRILIGLNYMGLFDDLACFNHTLSQKEIKSIYNHKKSLLGLLK